MLLEILEQQKRCGNFIRIFPSQGSDIYHKYFEVTRNSNRFVYQCIYGNSIFSKNDHIKEVKKTSSIITKKIDFEAITAINSDDILIEYIRRILVSVKAISAAVFKQTWKQTLINFINGSMWSDQLDANQPYILWLL